MAAEPQSFENHARTVFGYHVATYSLLLVALVLSVIRLAQAPSVDGALPLVLTLALILNTWYTRAFPLRVQDRLIRLEERLRMERLLPGDLKPRVAEFTTDQVVALRFASDAELPALARRVLDEGLSDRKEIKILIGEWRPDHERV